MLLLLLLLLLILLLLLLQQQQVSEMHEEQAPHAANSDLRPQKHLLDHRQVHTGKPLQHRQLRESPIAFLHFVTWFVYTIFRPSRTKNTSAILQSHGQAQRGLSPCRHGRVVVNWLLLWLLVNWLLFWLLVNWLLFWLLIKCDLF